MGPVTNISVHRNYLDNEIKFSKLEPGKLFLPDDNPHTMLKLCMKINNDFAVCIIDDNLENIGKVVCIQDKNVIAIPKYTISLFSKDEYTGDSKEELPFSFIPFDSMKYGDVFTEYGRIYMKVYIKSASNYNAVLIYDPYKNGNITTYFFGHDKVARFNDFKVSLFY